MRRGGLDTSWGSRKPIKVANEWFWWWEGLASGGGVGGTSENPWWEVVWESNHADIILSMKRISSRGATSWVLLAFEKLVSWRWFSKVRFDCFLGKFVWFGSPNSAFAPSPERSSIRREARRKKGRSKLSDSICCMRWIGICARSDPEWGIYPKPCLISLALCPHSQPAESYKTEENRFRSRWGSRSGWFSCSPARGWRPSSPFQMRDSSICRPIVWTSAGTNTRRTHRVHEGGRRSSANSDCSSECTPTWSNSTKWLRVAYLLWIMMKGISGFVFEFHKSTDSESEGNPVSSHRSPHSHSKIILFSFHTAQPGSPAWATLHLSEAQVNG